MSTQSTVLLAAYVLAILLLAVPMGRWLAAVAQGRALPFDSALLRLSGAAPEREQSWREYATAVLVFNVLGVIVVYAILRQIGRAHV